MINIDEVFKSTKTWKKEFNKSYDYIKQNIGYDKCFKKTVDVYFPTSGYVHNMYISDYIINLIMWRPSIKLEKALTSDMIFDCNMINQDKIKQYLDNTYVRYYRTRVAAKLLNVELAKVIERLKSIVEDFGMILGVSYSMYDIIQIMESDEDFNNAIHTKLDEGMQAADIETYGKSQLDIVMKRLKKSDSGFRPMLNSGVGFNPAQLQEYLVIVGNKPGLDGKTIPRPINTNILIGKLNDPADYTIDAMSGRKAQIMNKVYTGDSGYFARQLSLLNMDVYLNEDLHYNCRTNHYLKYKIDDEESLRRIEGRYYKLKKNGPYFKVVKYNDDQLIGKTIYMRSPITCASKDGICHICYGEMSKSNQDIHIGIFASTHISSRFTQNILSSKHSLMTKSNKIEMNDVFYKLFSIDGNHVVTNSGSDDLYNGKYLKLTTAQLEMSVEIDNDDEENTIDMDEVIMTTDFIYCESFDIVDSNGNILYSIEEKNGCKFLLSDYMVKMVDHYGRKNSAEIPLSILSSDTEENGEFLFSMDIINNELTKTLELVKGLLEKESHSDCYTIEDLIYKLNRYLIEGKINTQLVHAEILCRNLVRDKNNILELPDYHDNEIDYDILTIKKALMNHPSPMISMSFERVNLQLKRVSTYRKYKSSMLDNLYKLRLTKK